MKKNETIKVGISVGDINGIGIEIILKTFEDLRMLELCTPIIFASNKTFSIHKKQLNIHTQTYGVDSVSKCVPNKINLVNIWKEQVEVNFGEETKSGGKYAFLSLQAAVKALKNNEIDVLVTAPINKHNIQSEDFNFSGHTEYLEANLEGESLMILMTDELKIGLITGHIPIQKIAETITADLIEKKVKIMHNSLIQDFKISKPKIAVLGLNPHCGDNGVIGDEDDNLIKPTLEKIQAEGKLVYGPFSADSFFGSGSYKNFDGVLAMYHDQGLAPFKTLSFGNGVNFTAGLNKIRTSPDHGTAFEISGKGEANNNSFKEALYTAIDVFKNRSEYSELSENKLRVRK
ncbi:4-hydroxythreonine-4-phosphate dehydrogenase PdxA [Aureibaculum sp. 2210JD6-5]|uniref:4-hydroxythreonine-4-phosphate dehydrogenase PdxA n=1 Tax=Aureibaculum sp. 2210JD6-5 TaxID=3103957 RepID=UPI002AAE9057|nr:4-hydroxythreonine-4-phosphate dehydrogenase PdxA [Aureibaculum sp. 2210JD6-5]MDY7396003.1 4-hydroxythreonine-4-phosphate dehydrogenase PdxA [Aureibaculum sp. 2210JD6-5]